MSFQSYGFLFVLLPVAVAGWWLLNWRGHGRLAQVFLLGVSLVFYGIGSLAFLPLLAGSILFNFFVGKGLGRVTRRRKALLVLGLLGNLGVLGYFKYMNFFLENLNLLLGTSFGALSLLRPWGSAFSPFSRSPIWWTGTGGQGRLHPAGVRLLCELLPLRGLGAHRLSRRGDPPAPGGVGRAPPPRPWPRACGSFPGHLEKGHFGRGLRGQGRLGVFQPLPAQLHHRLGGGPQPPSSSTLTSAATPTWPGGGEAAGDHPAGELRRALSGPDHPGLLEGLAHDHDPVFYPLSLHPLGGQPPGNRPDLREHPHHLPGLGPVARGGLVLCGLGGPPRGGHGGRPAAGQPGGKAPPGALLGAHLWLCEFLLDLLPGGQHRGGALLCRILARCDFGILADGFTGQFQLSEVTWLARQTGADMTRLALLMFLLFLVAGMVLCLQEKPVARRSDRMTARRGFWRESCCSGR